MPVSEVFTYYNALGLLTAFLLSLLLLAEYATSDEGVHLGILVKVGLLFIESISLWNSIKICAYIWSPKFDGLLSFDERAFITGGGLVLILALGLAIKQVFADVKRPTKA